jgi:hypothetical protein
MTCYRGIYQILLNNNENFIIEHKLQKMRKVLATQYLKITIKSKYFFLCKNRFIFKILK